VNATALWPVIALLVCLAAYSAFVSYLVIRAEAYSSQQKLIQVLVVWLLPLLGSVVVHWFAAHGTTQLPPVERHPYRKNELPE
jgi:hypothetical protein